VLNKAEKKKVVDGNACGVPVLDTYAGDGWL